MLSLLAAAFAAPPPLSFTETDGYLGVVWQGEEVFRVEPTCTTSRDCLRKSRKLVAWPAWQREPVAERLLGPHCDEGDLWACIGMDAVRGAGDVAWACIDEHADCLLLVDAQPDSPSVPLLLESACEAKNGEACVRRGEGLADPERLEWLDRACEAGTACEERDVLAERVARRELADRCWEDGNACMDLADRLGSDETFDDLGADDWVLESCVTGEPRGCQRFELQTGRWGLDDPVVQGMLARLEQRCGAAEPEAGACRVAGSLLRRTRVRDERYLTALERLTTACEQGDGEACIQAGSFRKLGKARKHPLDSRDFWETG